MGMDSNIPSGSFTDFNIEDTSILGDQSILSDLMDEGGDTVSTTPDKVEKIETTITAETTEAPKEKEPISQVLDSFLEDEDEEEEEEVEEKELLKAPLKKESTKDTEEDSSEVNKFSALAKDLLKLGVFSQDDEEDQLDIKDPEEFLERFKYEGEKIAHQKIDNFLGQFGEDYQKAFEAIYVKGVNPKDYFATAGKIQNFSELDLTKESNQVSVMKQALLDQGLEHEDVETEVERLKNYGDLESTAQRYHKLLVKKEGAKLAQMEQDSQMKLKLQNEAKQQYVSNVNTVLQNKLKTKDFDGIPINNKLAQELQDFLLVDRYRTPSGETLSEFDKKILDLKRPENHELKVKVALLLKTLEKDPSLSTIQKAGLSKKSGDLFESLTKHAEKAPNKNKQKPEPTSWFS